MPGLGSTERWLPCSWGSAPSALSEACCASPFCPSLSASSVYHSPWTPTALPTCFPAVLGLQVCSAQAQGPVSLPGPHPRRPWSSPPFWRQVITHLQIHPECLQLRLCPNLPSPNPTSHHLLHSPLLQAQSGDLASDLSSNPSSPISQLCLSLPEPQSPRLSDGDACDSVPAGGCEEE